MRDELEYEVCVVSNGQDAKSLDNLLQGKKNWYIVRADSTSDMIIYILQRFIEAKKQDE